MLQGEEFGFSNVDTEDETCVFAITVVMKNLLYAHP